MRAIDRMELPSPEKAECDIRDHCRLSPFPQHTMEDQSLFLPAPASYFTQQLDRFCSNGSKFQLQTETETPGSSSCGLFPQSSDGGIHHMEMKQTAGNKTVAKGFLNVWKWKKLRRILGHFGLLLAVTVYTAIGALIFRELEHPAEISRLNDLIRELEVERRVFMLSFTCKEDARKCQQVFNNYEKAISEACKGGVELPLNVSSAVTSKWSFTQSAFFASTVLTTIGYGNIVPFTFWGRLFCVMFALIGIPLTLSVIADVGVLLATAVSALHARAKSYFPIWDILPNLTTSRTRWLSAIAGVIFLILYLAAGAAVFVIWEKDWGFFEGFYFCFITLTTIGFGDLVPQNPNHMLICTLYILMGLALTSAIIELVRRQYAQSWRTIQALSGPLAESLRRFGECAGTGLDVTLLQNDLKKMLALVNSSRKTSNTKEWRDTMDSVLKDITLHDFQQPAQKKPKILQIVVYESSV